MDINKIKKIRNILLVEFLLFTLLTAATVVLHENDIILSGALTGDKQSEFILLSVMEVLTLGFIPLSLKLLKIKYVRKNIAAAPYKNMLKWGLFRLCLIGLPAVINTIMYYSYMNAAFGYLAIIGILCLFFIYPGTERCINEIEEK